MFLYGCLAMAALLVAVDQGIKYWAVEVLKNVETIPLIQDVLHLTYRENQGAAFSIFEGQTKFLILVTALMLLAVLYALLTKKIKQPVMIASFSLILAGGIGNLIDRAFRAGGIVIDYIDFRLINFAVFNFADICVVTGTCLFVLYLLFIEPKEEKKSQALKKESADHE